MKGVDMHGDQEDRFLTLNLFRVLSSLAVFSSVIVQFYEIHMEILKGQNFGLLFFCKQNCSVCI